MQVFPSDERIKDLENKVEIMEQQLANVALILSNVIGSLDTLLGMNGIDTRKDT